MPLLPTSETPRDPTGDHYPESMDRAAHHLAVITNALEPGEQLLATVPAMDIVTAMSMRGTITGVLAVSDRRFLFSGASRNTSDARSLLFSDILSFDVRYHRNSADFRFETDPPFSGFLTKQVERATTFLQAARRAIARSRGETDEPDVSARLAQLDELHATGVLSDSEFRAAKKRLDSDS